MTAHRGTLTWTWGEGFGSAARSLGKVSLSNCLRLYEKGREGKEKVFAAGVGHKYKAIKGGGVRRLMAIVMENNLYFNISMIKYKYG